MCLEVDSVWSQGARLGGVVSCQAKGEPGEEGGRREKCVWGGHGARLGKMVGMT